MKEQIDFIDKEKMYSLEHDDAGFILSVLCGGFAMYEVKIRLTEQEIREYKNTGKEFLDSLAKDVSHSPNQFKERWLTG